MSNLAMERRSAHDSGPAAECNGVRIMPESWAFRVAGFLAAATDDAIGEVEVRPKVLFLRNNAMRQIDHLTGFNIRERHFRCIETFFVRADALGEIETVIAVEGIRTRSVVLTASLLVSKVLPSLASEGGDTLAKYRRDVIVVAAEFCAASRLRFTYLIDSNGKNVVGGKMCQLLLQTPEDAGLFVEARIRHETGRDREIVMLGFPHIQPASAGEQAPH